MLKLMQLKRELLAKNMCVVSIIMNYINYIILKTEDFDIFILLEQILEFYIRKFNFMKEETDLISFQNYFKICTERTNNLIYALS